MKIEWLNDDKSKAVITRGFLWWKRYASVFREKEKYRETYCWWFTETRNAVPEKTNKRIEHQREWTKVPELPMARVVK